MKKLSPWPVAIAVSLIGIFGSSQPSRADMTLTPTGTGLGFTLNTFATMNPGNSGCCGGPFGLAVSSDGHVFVSDGNLNTIYVLPDVNGQSPGTATATSSQSTGTTGAAAVGTTFWGGLNGSFTTFNTSLTTITPQTVGNGSGGSYSPYLGMAATPDGHIVATSFGGLIEITPGDPVARLINGGVFADGVSISPDGTKIIAEVGGSIQVFNRTTGALLQTFFPNNSPDGTGVISGSALNGDIVVAGNDGTIVLIDPSKSDGDPLQLRTIATGGTRLDYTAPDITNGTLLIDAADLIYRLGCNDCTIGTAAVPEPSTWAMMILGFLGLGYMGFRQSRHRMLAGA
jgi:hypothetical protein